MTAERLLSISGERVLLDTNVIMRMEDARTATVREVLRSFVKNNDVCICDTVMYELLRNLNAKRFRDRHAFLREAGMSCLPEGTAAVRLSEK